MFGELINIIVTLYNNGIFEDVILISGGMSGISINTLDANNFTNLALSCGYSSIAIKVRNKLRFEKTIELFNVVDFKLNRRSLIIKTKPNIYNGDTVNKPAIKIKW